MKVLLGILLFLHGIIPSFSSTGINYGSTDSLLLKSIKDYHIPGASLVIVRGDSVLYSKGFGFADLENQVGFSPDNTVVRCGSVSKSFTATAVMILVDQGKLQLNEPISTWLNPEEMKSFGLKGKKITLHQLLTHSAGFDERLFGSHVNNFDDWIPLREYFRKFPLKVRAEPGTILSYNDQGIALAGYIVEKVSGQPFYDFIKTNIFDPLEMFHSSFQPMLPEKLQNNLAKSYSYKGQSYVPYSYDYILTYPAAGLVSTPSDISKFLRFHLNYKNAILDSSMIELMHRRQFTNHPKLRGWCYGFAEWYENDRRMIFKDGQATGFNSRLVMMPDQKWGFYLVWNRSIFNRGGEINEANRLKSEVTSFLLDQFFPDTSNISLSEPEPYVSGPDFNFEGTYIDMSIGVSNWSKILTLMLQSPVKRAVDTTWSILGGKYIRTDSLLFQWYQGHEFYTAFTPVDGRIKFLHIGTGSREKVPFYEKQLFQLILLGILYLAMIIAIVLSLIHFRKMRSSNFILTGVGGLLNLLGLPLFISSIYRVDFQVLYKGPTDMMVLGSWLPFLGSLMIIMGMIGLFGKKKIKWFIWILLFNLLIIPFLIYWNFPII